MEVKEWLESEDIKRLIFEIREKKDKLIPFVGSGVSIPSGLPSWKSLIKEIAKGSKEEAKIEQFLEKNNYLLAGELVRRGVNSSNFEEKITKLLFSKIDYSETEIISSILNLNSKAILTTNYDTILENCYNKRAKAPAQIFSYDSQNLASINKTDNFYIFYIHGNIKEPQNIILSKKDYLNLMHNNENFNSVLSNIFASYSILFIGYSLSDPDLALLIEKLQVISKDISPIRYFFIQSTEDEAKKFELEEFYNINFIEYPKDRYDFIPYFLNALNDTKVENKEVKKESEFLEYPIKYVEYGYIEQDYFKEERTIIDKTAELFDLKTQKYIHKNSRFGVIEENGIVRVIALVNDFSINDIKEAINKVKNSDIFKDIISFQIITHSYLKDIRIYCSDNGFSYIEYKKELYERLDIDNFLKKEIKEFKDKFTLNSDSIKQPFIENQKSHYLENVEDKLNILDEINNFIDSNNTHLAIIGEFGSGKTTLSQYILLKYAKGYLSDENFPIIPIRIELKHHSDFDTFEELILNWFKEHSIEDINWH